MFGTVLNTCLMSAEGTVFTAQEVKAVYLVSFTEEILNGNIRILHKIYLTPKFSFNFFGVTPTVVLFYLRNFKLPSSAFEIKDQL